MGRRSVCTAVSNKFCAVMSRLVRQIGMCCCRCVSSHLTQLKVPQRVTRQLTSCMAVNPSYLLNMPSALLPIVLFRPFRNVLLVCKLLWTWFVLLLRVPLRPCLFRPINAVVTSRLRLVPSLGFQLNTFAWLLALHVNLLPNGLGHIVWLHLWDLSRSAWRCRLRGRFMMFFTFRNFVLLSVLMVLFHLVRMLLSVLLPMTTINLKLRISLIIALAVVLWNTLLSGKVTLSSNPLGNRPLTCVVHVFCRLIVNAEDCVETMRGGDVRVCFFALVVCCAASIAAQHCRVAIALGR